METHTVVMPGATDTGKFYGELQPILITADAARPFTNKGLEYQSSGDISKAIDYLEQALKIYKAIYQADHPDVAESLSNVGLAYLDLGDTSKVLDYREQTLKMYQALHKVVHQDVARSLNTVGVAYKILGDAKKGIDYTDTSP
jgi:tetratricopeptide (TPR) repeat protein